MTSRPSCSSMGCTLAPMTSIDLSPRLQTSLQGTFDTRLINSAIFTQPVSDHFDIRPVHIFLTFAASGRVIHRGIETNGCPFTRWQTARLICTALEIPGNFINVFLRTAMATPIKPVIVTALIHALRHDTGIDPIHKAVIDRIADQSFTPTISKPGNETFCVGFFASAKTMQ